MSTFKDRLLEEKQQLDERIVKLHSFIHGDKFETISAIQRSLLQIQYQAMVTYTQCLMERLVWLESEPANVTKAAG